MVRCRGTTWCPALTAWSVWLCRGRTGALSPQWWCRKGSPVAPALYCHLPSQPAGGAELIHNNLSSSILHLPRLSLLFIPTRPITPAAWSQLTDWLTDWLLTRYRVFLTGRCGISSSQHFTRNLANYHYQFSLSKSFIWNSTILVRQKGSVRVVWEPSPRLTQTRCGQLRLVYLIFSGIL